MAAHDPVKLLVKRERTAEREIYESRILIDFLMVYGLDLKVLRNYSTPMVNIALAWKDGSLSEEQIQARLETDVERIRNNRINSQRVRYYKKKAERENAA